MQPASPSVPGYAEGGLVQPGGATPPIDTGVGAGGPGLSVPDAAADAATSGEDMEVAAKRIMAENPQIVQQMIDAAQEGIDSGQFSEELVTVGGKMAVVVSRNPAMYPKMYERLTSMGAQNIPPEYDPEFIMTVIMMYLAWQQKGGATGDVGGTGDDGVQDFRDGGYVTHGSKAAGGGQVVGMGGPRDDMIRADLSNGEFVIPAHAVRDKGVDHFQKNYIDRYKAPKNMDIA
jgi:hypothetical protein